MELDKLTSLLPFSEDVRSRLDKLSVLRLSVGYLKVKSYFNASMKKTGSRENGRPTGIVGGKGQTLSSLNGGSFCEGELLLQALNGFVMVITAEGYVFYSSSTVQDYLGFHQKNSTIVNYTHQPLPPENSSFLERSFCCRFRCLLDNSSGFLALNFHGRLKYLHGQNKMAEDGTIAPPQLALFVIATPLQPPSILEIRSKTIIFQTKHKLDFTPLGIDTRGKVVLGYNEIELCMRGSGYQFIHAADMMHCADNHLRMMKTGESGLTVFRLLTKVGKWVWVQSNARLVYKGGRPDFIVARQKPLTNEEGEEHLRQRTLQLPFSFATGEAVLYETTPSPDMAKISSQIKEGKITKPAMLPPSSLLSSMLKQDERIYEPNSDPNSQPYLDNAFWDSHALLNVPGKSWEVEKNTVGIKKESAVQEMMESLQQIIEDSSMCGNLKELSLDQRELREWEHTLQQMSSLSNNEASVELNDILTNDIFSYVENMLFKESSNNMNDTLPECLSELQLQRDLNDLIDISEGLETGSSGNPVEMFVEPLCESMIFDSSLAGQQNQATLVQQVAPSQQNQAELQMQVQNHIQRGNLSFPERGLLPNLQNQDQHVDFHNHSSVLFNQAIQPSGQWAGPQSTSSENISHSQNIMLNHAPNVHLKAQFPLGNQSIDNQRLTGTWQQLHPSVQQGHHPLPKVPNNPNPNPNNVQNISNVHQHVQQVPLPMSMLQSNFGSESKTQPSVIGRSVYSQHGGFVQLSSPMVGQQQEYLQTPNAIYGQQGELLHPSNAPFGDQEEPVESFNAVYSQQGELLNVVAPAPISSCMFERAVHAPVIDMRYGAAGQDVDSSSCQKSKEFMAQNSVQGLYVLQNMSAEILLNKAGTIPDSAMAFHLQQQFLNCNSKTQGRLKFLHGQNRCVDDGVHAPPLLALFVVATPLRSPSILEIRTKNMIFRTKHELDFTPLACDAKGKIVLGYTEAELRARGSGYQFIHAADMLKRLTVFRLLTKENQWKWVQANARLIYKNSKPDYIIATQRPLGEEEGGEHLRKRSMHLPFTFATGEALLYQTSFPVPGFSDNIVAESKSGKAKKANVVKGSEEELDPSSLLGAIMRQDKSVYICQAAPEPNILHQFSKQKESSTSCTLMGSENWTSVSNDIPKPEVTTSFDPLLVTLDSLLLENEGNCFNSELFSTLENLGLNAEDLELLLLDKRMIQVDMEQEYIPSLNDLLTNNEILSFSPSLPIPQLSTQMQQHLSSQSLHQKYHSWIPQTQVTEVQQSPVLPNAISDFTNGHWVPQQTMEELSQLSVKSLGSTEHLHWHQNQLQALFSWKNEDVFGGDSQNEITPNLQWQESNYVDQPVTTSSHVDYSMATGSVVEINGESLGGFQSDMLTSSSSQQFNAKQPPTNYSHPNQNSSVDPFFPSPDVYGMFDSTQSNECTYRQSELRPLGTCVVVVVVVVGVGVGGFREPDSGDPQRKSSSGVYERPKACEVSNRKVKSSYTVKRTEDRTLRNTSLWKLLVNVLQMSSLSWV
ncbi:Aryl hydrocarbon receptor [Bagarius yarrelli]|uniref:Aryl hydrocarbon receptor n=1 Tax=Bagarius yarrelli TaxID=175774 RepID=A0A556VVZ0_BAGYA|nr:Aryl hydrocarbon receptor [Bagarius yarrelli]